MTMTLPSLIRMAALVAALALLMTGAGSLEAQTIFRSPSLGFTQPSLPRVAPPLSTGPVRTVPPALPQPFVANQCQLAAGTCPLGRLQRSGNRCYCASGPGTTRQGSSQVKPQGANPSSQ